MRLIDADHLIERIKGGLVEGTDGSYMFQRFVDEEPTAEPIKHGKWTRISTPNICGERYVYTYYQCSNCRKNVEHPYPYCKWCGSKNEVTE